MTTQHPISAAHRDKTSLREWLQATHHAGLLVAVMKNRTLWLILPPLALTFSACKKSQPETTAPAASTPETSAAAPSVPATPKPEVPAVTPAQRAEKLGFARHLTEETEQIITVHNGKNTVERVKRSNFWKLVTEIDPATAGDAEEADGEEIEVQVEGEEAEEAPAAADEAASPAVPAGEEEEEEEEDEAETTEVPVQVPDAPVPGDDAETAAPDAAGDDLAGDEEGLAGPAALFANEVTIALGKDSGNQVANLMKFSESMNYHQMKAMVKWLASRVNAAGSENPALPDQFSAELFKEILADPEGGLPLWEKAAMPPITFAFRSAPGKTDASTQQVSSMLASLAMLGDKVEPATRETGGAKFSGSRIIGKKLAEEARKSRAQIEKDIDPASVDKLIAALEKKDIVILSGSIGEYTVLFIGPSADALHLTADADKSLVAGDRLAFADSYLPKDLAMLYCGEKDSVATMVKSTRGLASYIEGIRDGLADAPALGDTSKLQSLFKEVGEREAALRSMMTFDSSTWVAFFEDGLKIETQGGIDQGAIDWSAKNQLRSLGDSPDVALFANYTANANYARNANAYLESFTETAYAAAAKAAELDIKSADFAKFKETMTLIDKEFRAEAITLGTSLTRDLSEGLGKESALVVDLGGSVPPVPGLPQAAVDKGKFPRVTVISPVTDRAKLAASWDKGNTAITSIVAKIGKISGKEFPMQKPMSSEKNGYTTWFFSMPLLTDDFVPSVTLNNEWFAISSSKNQALDLLGKASTATSGGQGMVMNVNFAKLQEFCRHNLKIAGENAEALKLDKSDLDRAAKVIGAMDELDSLHISSRKNDAEGLRCSIHFKTR